MKARAFFLILAVSLTLFTTIHAQKKLDEALYQFQSTAFMKQFREMKNKAEGEIVVFKQEQSKYAPRDIQKVKMAYDETARRFNKILTDIKRDFLDKRKMKYIQQFPDSYSKGLELELYKLSDFYRTNFQQTVRDVTGEETFGNPLLILLPQLVMLSSDLIKQMQKIKRENAQFTESYLQQKFVQPNRFPYWQEVGQSNNNYDNGSSNNGNGSADDWNNDADTWDNNSNNGGWDNNNNNWDDNNSTDWNNTGGNNSNNNNSTNNNDWNTNSNNSSNNNNNFEGSSNSYQNQVPPTKPVSKTPKSKFTPPTEPKPHKKKGKARVH